MDIADVIKNIPLTAAAEIPAGDVASVCYHSGACEKNSLFVAIRGLKTDGHRFAADAAAKGARWIIHENPIDLPEGAVSLPVIDSRRALGIAARNFYRHPSAELCLTGVTGTNGKTTVTYLLESVLAASGFSPGVLGTVNYRYGNRVFPAPNTTPESLELQKILRQMADDKTTHCVADISSHALDLGRVDDCDFDVAIFTNLTQDHLDYHGTMEAYYRAKERLFHDLIPRSRKDHPYKRVINGDDPWSARLRGSDPALTFGLDSRHDVWADDVHFSLAGIEARIHIGERYFPVVSSLTGQFNLYNILAAAAGAFALGVPLAAIREGIARMKGVPGRMERVSASGEPWVFVDYAHTDDALAKALEMLRAFGDDRLVTLFGCGGDRDHGKRPLMGKVVSRLSHQVIVTSDNPRSEDPLSIIADIEAGIEPETGRVSPEELLKNGRRAYCVIPDRREAIETAIRLAHEDSIILIAGKGHEDYQIIGEKRLFFDDRVTARSCLDQRKRMEQ
jgi:UDP-N-acetylmuramoyl-L-alanyl-D-glutamate--2,6-diaminopimelate ligase